MGTEKQIPPKKEHGDITVQDAQSSESQSIGAYLREQRIHNNLGLEEVSETTGITKAVLEALENEDREQLPAEVYVKAFYKKYAELLGIGPEEVDAKYQQQSHSQKNIGHSSNFSTVVTLKGNEERMFSGILRRAYLPIIILILGILFYWLYKNYLEPSYQLGISYPQFPSVFSLLLPGPSDFFC